MPKQSHLGQGAPIRNCWEGSCTRVCLPLDLQTPVSNPFSTTAGGGAAGFCELSLATPRMHFSELSVLFGRTFLKRYATHASTNQNHKGVPCFPTLAKSRRPVGGLGLALLSGNDFRTVPPRPRRAKKNRFRFFIILIVTVPWA